MWKNRECGKQILRACEGTGRAEKAGESGKKYGLLQLYMGILLLLVVSVSGNVPYSGVNREKISLYGSRAEQGDKKEDPAAVQSAVKPEPLNLNSRSAVLMDADTGRVLYGKNETEDLPMASTTKIMTCILALENAGPETEVLVSDRAASMPEVKLHIKKGEKYRMEDLLYSLMLESHNDSAVAIAEAVAGSVEKFADMMNRKDWMRRIRRGEKYIPQQRKTWRGSSDTASCSHRPRTSSSPSQGRRPMRSQIFRG